MQIGADGRGRDIDDEDVEDGHELAGEDDREQPAGARRPAVSGPALRGPVVSGLAFTGSTEVPRRGKDGRGGVSHGPSLWPGRYR
ncbi:hypothetical protein GCM10017744_066330 [Streptomyces antimycoticus]